MSLLKYQKSIMGDNLKKLSESEIFELIEDLNQEFIPVDSIVRRILYSIHGSEYQFNLTDVVGMGIPLSTELARRLQQITA